MATVIVAPSDEEVQQLERAFAEPPFDETPRPHAARKQSDEKHEQIAQTIILTMLFVAPALICTFVACANDPDIWWHLRTGQWISQHHAFPRVDSYSGPNAGKPWQAYSWLFELVLYQLFQRLGLVGIVAYSSGMVLAISVALWHLVKRLQPDFFLVTAIMLGTCCSLGHTFSPRPWFFTILFFILEIDILMHARKTGKTRELLWLPLIFALWSNTHIQFIDGLLVLGLAATEAVVTRWGVGVKTGLRAQWICSAAVGSVVASMANPYGWHIYKIAYDLASQPGVLDKIAELKSIPFRSLTDYSVLFLALAATAALAWRRRFQVFEVGLLVFAAVISFRSQRDIWVMSTVAAALLATSLVGRQPASVQLPKSAPKLAALAAALVLFASFHLMHINNNALQSEVVKTYPKDAVDAILTKGYAGPLYNDFDYGGYLIWALRMPVSIDGRAAFYGDAAIDRSMATWNGQPDWKSDTALTSAGVVIGPVKSALVQLLRMDAHYQLVYEDKVAVVFIAHK